MKKLMMTLAVAYVAFLPLMAYYEEYANGYTWPYRINGNTVEIFAGETGLCGYTSTPAISPQPTGAVTIPSTLGGKPVTSIGYHAFYGCSGLTSVTIPESVTSIGESAFAECSGLTNVSIPNSVTSIGRYAFEECNGLTSVTIPASVTSIGDDAFYGTSFYDNLPDGLVVFGKVAYRMKGSCPASVTIPEGVTSIGDYAFAECSGLTNVTIPNSVTSIGRCAFLCCSGLTNVTIPNSVTSIEELAFAGCEQLESMEIPDSLEVIGNNAFGCERVDSDLGNSYTPFGRKLEAAKVSVAAATLAGNLPAVTTVVPQVVTTVVQQVESPYALTNSVADRAIASVTVDGDCAIDEFVLVDGKVYDCVLRIVNTANAAVTLTLPEGYTYETFKGAKPLTIPANSRNILTITRTADRVFLVSRRELAVIE